MQLKLLATVALGVILGGCLGINSSSSAAGGSQSGSASFQISAVASGPFVQLADTVVLTISAPDMLTITKGLTISGSTITGSISGIPAGSNRLFEIKVYDSTGTLQYQGSVTANVTGGGNITLDISVIRIVGGANINGSVVEAPVVGWTHFDGFEGATIGSSWVPQTTNIGGLTTSQKKSGSKAFQTTHDYRYTFSNSLTSGEISWWYYDQGGTYFFILTDTSKADLTVDNLHMTTVVPGGLASNMYSFYYKTGGYQQVSRVAGWRKMVVTVGNGQVSWYVDDVLARSITQILPVVGFQLSSAIVDDFYVVSNTN